MELVDALRKVKEARQKVVAAYSGTPKSISKNSEHDKQNRCQVPELDRLSNSVHSADSFSKKHDQIIVSGKLVSHAKSALELNQGNQHRNLTNLIGTCRQFDKTKMVSSIPRNLHATAKLSTAQHPGFTTGSLASTASHK